MGLDAILSAIDLKETVASGGLILVLLMTILQIAPIKVNPWSWLARSIGRVINKEVIDKVDSLEKETQAIRSEMTEQTIVGCRIRILRFGDEVLHGDRHSQDHFDQTLQDIDRYERYCKAHPDFQNSITGLTIARIKDVYRKCQKENDFM